MTDVPTSLPTSVLGGIGVIEQIVAAVFEGAVRTIGIDDHLVVVLLHGVYRAEGWMR